MKAVQKHAAQWLRVWPPFEMIPIRLINLVSHHKMYMLTSAQPEMVFTFSEWANEPQWTVFTAKYIIFSFTGKSCTCVSSRQGFQISYINEISKGSRFCLLFLWCTWKHGSSLYPLGKQKCVLQSVLKRPF